MNHPNANKVKPGDKFERLIVLSKAENSNTGHIRWNCRCACGKEKTIQQRSLVSGNTKSCGCYCKDNNRILRTKHGGYYTAEYKAWQHMIQRCNTPTHQSYKDYGGRGIKVCERWKDFKNFINDMGQRPSDKHSLERVDVNKDYEPANCKWATYKEQANNRRTSRMVTYQGVTEPLKVWTDFLGLDYQLILSRIYRGWSVDKAFETPKRIINVRQK